MAPNQSRKVYQIFYVKKYLPIGQSTFWNKLQINE